MPIMKLRKPIAHSLLALTSMLVVLVAAAFLLYPAEYLWRKIRWGETDVYNYRIAGLSLWAF